MKASHTEDIFNESDRDLRASEIGVIESSKISRASSPKPTVKANKPAKIYHNIEIVIRFGRNTIKSTQQIKRLTNDMGS